MTFAAVLLWQSALVAACAGVLTSGMPIIAQQQLSPVAPQFVPAETGSLLAGAGQLQLNRERRQAKSNKKTKAFEQECLAAHNKWRRLHQANDLVFDKKITAFAQKRADFIAASDGDEFRHPNDLPYGENLAWHSRPTKSCADLIKMWYDEVELYNYKLGRFDHETGHFTQLVWRNTERVGCARAFSKGPIGGIYLVCNYDPPGNFLGEAIENVLVSTRAKNPVQQPTVVPATTTTTLRSTTASAVTALPPQVSSTTAVVANSAAVSTTTTAKPETAKRKKKGKKNKKGKKKNKKNKNKKKKNKPSTTTTHCNTNYRPPKRATSYKQPTKLAELSTELI